ncbi:Guided entry of tail-anchored s 1 [Hyphodiscus hymeniophilus]|uniref:Guided entry of tail-anchored s 1 n=1 Tax=Hyphodiscus hymeniophilus TaxID=353542 RepID=A0A9P6VR11_9HELO|nr:Guided entry of tail-anchored s 1 [Hyphodiscus hymeniophilus]
MPSILLMVFVLQLAIHLVNTFGAATINSLLWSLYNSLPTPTSHSVQEQRELKAQFLKLKTEMNATSSQDEFAKEAGEVKYDILSTNPYHPLTHHAESSTDSTKATFDTAVSTLRWLGTSGTRMFMQFWFSKQAMFWIPKGWVPYYAEWLLSFPRAPLGISDALVATMALIMGAKKGTAQKGEPMKFAGEKAGMEKSKKEL